MSFNLDRFRYEREREKKKNDTPTSTDDDGGCTSSDSEKENKHASAAGCPPSKKQERGAAPAERQTVVKICGRVGEEEVLGTSNGKGQQKSKMDKKLAKLQELFPQKDRDQLLEVIESTSTLEGAVATCLTSFRDDDEGRPDSPSSPNRISSSLTQMRNSGKPSDISQDELVVPPNKRRRKVSPSGRVDSEEEEPVWEEVNAMVRSLQRKFPGLDKKELRAVLQEHNWCLDDASEVLHMFSESAEQSNSPEAKGRNPKSAESHRGVKSGKKVGTHKTAAPSLSGWLVTPVTHPPLAAVKPRSATSLAAKRKRQAAGGLDSGSEDSEASLSSEFEGASSDSDLDSDGPDMQLRSQVLGFFQEASVDELTLMAACSLKKAQKIVALRPFDTWQDLKEILHKGNGLSEDLFWGCRVVLKEREVVLGLMKKCEKITQKMAKDVASVIERRTGSLKQPAVLNSRLQLKPYQLIGLNWLVLLHKNKLSGILADEMGLGKTVQVISFLASLYQEGIHGPHLITVPSSTLDNWIRELKLWCPSLKVLVYYGSIEDRRYLRYDILNGQVDFNIILTTYNLAIGNANDRSLFRKLKLQNAVFDEGHMLKNMNSLRYRHLMAINAKHRLLLTGTPLQNNLLEFMSLLNFIMPSMFSGSTSQISKMFAMKSSEEQSRFERDRIAQAKLIMKPFILRRVKSEVLKQLPAKEEKLEWCVMTENQRHLYCALQEKLKRSASGEKKELCNAMMQLRKMANHPLLHRQCYTSERLAAMSRLLLKEPTHHDADPALIQEDMEVMSDFELHQLCQLYPSLQGFQLPQDQLLDSGKFHVLSQLLGTIKDKGDRVVLFSQFTMMLDIVEVLLQHLSHRYVRLDGSTPIPDRMVLIDQFNTEPEIFVFLLSTRAGGLGINLTTANVVILHDIDCNPYNDKQAEDRCHRVGQTRTVQVIKLISQDSIEDCMLQVSQKKLKLEQDMTAAEEGDEGRVPEDMASLLKASLGL